MRGASTICTGTPPGVGQARKRFLKRGDKLRLGIAGLGEQQQEVTAWQLHNAQVLQLLQPRLYAAHCRCTTKPVEQNVKVQMHTKIQCSYKDVHNQLMLWMHGMFV